MFQYRDRCVQYLHAPYNIYHVNRLTSIWMYSGSSDMLSCQPVKNACTLKLTQFVCRLAQNPWLLDIAEQTCPYEIVPNGQELKCSSKMVYRMCVCVYFSFCFSIVFRRFDSMRFSFTQLVFAYRHIKRYVNCKCRNCNLKLSVCLPYANDWR